MMSFVAWRTADWNFVAVRPKPAPEIEAPMRPSMASPNLLIFSTSLSRRATFSARYLISA